MDKSMIAGTILGSVMAAGGGASMQFLAEGEPLITAQGVRMQPVALQEEAAVTVSPALERPAKGQVHAVDQPLPVSTTAQYSYQRTSPAFARVIGVTPVEETTTTPRQQCMDEPVTEAAPVRDTHKIIGTVSGALLGGILGHQIGDGRGKDLATVAGAAAGAFGGRKAQQQVQNGKSVTTLRQRCETVMDTAVEVIGYDVRYEVDGQVSTVRMDYHPGKRIMLDNGEMMI